MQFLHDGRPPVVREAVYEPPAEIDLSIAAAGADHANTSAQDSRLAQCGQQAMGHSPVRSRSARRQRHQAAGGREQRRTQRRGRRAARARLAAGHRRGLRHESRLWRFRYLSHGRQRHRRGDAQLRRRGGRSGQDRDPRQFLLGQYRSARDAGFARSRGLGLPRPGHRAWQRRLSAARTA